MGSPILVPVPCASSIIDIGWGKPCVREGFANEIDLGIYIGRREAVGPAVLVGC